MPDEELGRLARWASDAKIIVTAIVTIIGALAAGGIWFNGYVQAKATEGLADQIGSENSAIRAAFQTMIDERAEEIERNLKEEIVRNRDLEGEKLDQLKSMIWKATNPSRRSGDPEPAWEGSD